LTISTIEPSPVDFSNQVRKVGIVNNSKSSFVKGYSTRLEQLLVMEEKWLAEKGTEAALTGLFDELAQDELSVTKTMSTPYFHWPFMIRIHNFHLRKLKWISMV